MISLLFAFTACSTVTDAPLPELAPQATFGQPDMHNEYPHVVTLLFVQNGQGYYSCTGTLLTPTVVLTAGHCVEGGGDQLNDVTYVRNTQDAVAGIREYENTQAWLDAEWVRAESVEPHPQYSDFAEFPNTYDVGLVLLPEETTTFENLDDYGVLPNEGFLEELLQGKNHRNRRFTIVGYGQQGEIPAFYQNDYERYFGQTTLININSAYTGDEMSAVFTNNPGKGNGSGGSCYGDSGGPLFYGDTNVIGAVVSFGFTPCIGVDYQFRMDTSVALEFVEDFLPQEE